MPRLPLYQAVALSCDVDPGRTAQAASLANLKHALRGNRQFFEKFADRMDQAEAHAGHSHTWSLQLWSYTPPLALCDVELDRFATWAKNVVKWDIPAELLEVADRLPIERGQAPARWPWGEYETKLLQHLAAAADRFWKRYDPGDPTTAPTNETVEDWLVSNSVPKRVAEVMAQILRADGVKRGPRK